MKDYAQKLMQKFEPCVNTYNMYSGPNSVQYIVVVLVLFMVLVVLCWVNYSNAVTT